MGQIGKKKWRVMLAICRSLKKGSSYFAACKAADITDGTLWRWRKEDARFDSLVQEIWDSRVHHVEDAHYKTAINGNFQAQQYFLNNRSRKRWQKEPDVVVHQTTVMQTGPIYKVAPMIVFAEEMPVPAIETTAETNGGSPDT